MIDTNLKDLKIEIKTEGEHNYHFKVQYKNEKAIFQKYRLAGETSNDSWEYSSELKQVKNVGKTKSFQINIQVLATRARNISIVKEYIICFDKSDD